jgi:hypothetical protein
MEDVHCMVCGGVMVSSFPVESSPEDGWVMVEERHCTECDEAEYVYRVVGKPQDLTVR